jgi:hypothetical protein
MRGGVPQVPHPQRRDRQRTVTPTPLGVFGALQAPVELALASDQARSWRHIDGRLNAGSLRAPSRSYYKLPVMDSPSPDKNALVPEPRIEQQ